MQDENFPALIAIAPERLFPQRLAAKISQTQNSDAETGASFPIGINYGIIIH